MKRSLQRRSRCIIVNSLLIAALGIASHPVWADNEFPGVPKTFQTDYQFRMAGADKDRSQIPAMLQYLKDTTPPKYGIARTILLSLSQIGDLAALPDLDNFIVYNDRSQQEMNLGHFSGYLPSPDLAQCAKAARARLIAESTGGSPREKVDRFLEEIGLTPAKLDVAMQREQKRRAVIPSLRAELYPGTNLEGYALRQLADMIWHGNYSEYAKVPAVTQIDFSTDRRAFLKFTLAQMTPEAGRKYLATLISGGTDPICQQLLIEMGRREAGPAIIAELSEMDAHRAQFQSSAYLGLLETLAATGDISQKAVFDRYSADSDPEVSGRAGGLETDRIVPFRASFDPGD